MNGDLAFGIIILFSSSHLLSLQSLEVENIEGEKQEI